MLLNKIVKKITSLKWFSNQTWKQLTDSLSRRLEFWLRPCSYSEMCAMIECNTGGIRYFDQSTHFKWTKPFAYTKAVGSTSNDVMITRRWQSATAIGGAADSLHQYKQGRMVQNRKFRSFNPLAITWNGQKEKSRVQIYWGGGSH